MKQEQDNASGKEKVSGSKNAVITLDDFNVEKLSELQNKKVSLKESMDKFPFVEIVDTATYELQKKSRTGVKSIRTALEAEKSTVVKKIKENILNAVSVEYDKLITDDVKPIENKHQAEVTRWEDIKEAEKQERDRIEEERKTNHRNNIENFFNLNKGAIENLDFETAKTFDLEPKADGEVVSEEVFEEFQDLFIGKLEVLKVQLSDKKRTLQQAEENRLEQLRLEELRLDQVRADGIKKSIENFFNYWSDLISRLTFENIIGLKKSFEAEKGLSCQEFQPLYAEKRAELVKQIEAKVSFLKDQEQLRIDREEVKAEKLKNLIISRKNELVSLGFDKDGAYDSPEFKMVISEDDLTAEEEEWKHFIQSTTEQIRVSKITVVIEEEKEIEQSAVSTEPEELNTEAETVSTEVPEDEIQDVDHEETLSEPSEQELYNLITNHINGLEYNGLLEACITLGLITEKE